MKRYFTNTRSGSNKFWSIEIKASSHHIQYGRIGAIGRLVVKAFATKAHAQAEANKRIKEKNAKGYKEAGTIPLQAKQANSAFISMNKKCSGP